MIATLKLINTIHSIHDDYMKTNKNDKTIVENVNEIALTVADVARELNIDPKRARAYLRKNVELYVARHQRFTKTSTLYKKTFDALNAYKNAKRVITQ